MGRKMKQEKIHVQHKNFPEAKDESEAKFPRKSLSFHGKPLSYVDTGKKLSETILITHANGFSAECYGYMIRAFSQTHRVIALDFAGHGESETPDEFSDWDFLRDQIQLLIQTEDLHNITGVGHSMGGSSLLRASLQCPERFNRLILLDPTFLSLTKLMFGAFFGVAIADRALNRRDTFKDLAFVRKVFRRLPSHARWDEEVFNDYLNSCFLTTGGMTRLRCLPEIEARYFRTPSFKLLKDYGKNTLEIHILIPEEYYVCSPGQARKIASGNKLSSVTIIPGASHVFPFEMKEYTLDKIKALIS